MRIVMLIGVLFGSVLVAKTQASNASTISVSALLNSIERQPGCGVLHIGSIANYSIVSGPAELIGTEVPVLVPCAEMPRQMYSREAGDLEAFEVGALHYLVLTRENTTKVTVLTDQLRPGLYILRAASLHEMRPDSGR